MLKEIHSSTGWLRQGRLLKPATLLAVLSLSPAALVAQDEPQPSDADASADSSAESEPAGQVRNQEGVLEESAAVAPEVEQPPLWDKVWGAMEFYKNDENKVIQSVKFTGRFQADYAWVDDPSYDDVSIRRFRLGFKTQWFQYWTLHAEVDLAPDDDPVYNQLTDAYIAWSRDANLQVTVGKHSAPFTLDGSTSSKSLLTVERSNIANNMWFTQEYFPGVSASGGPGNWRYHGGVYATGNDLAEFGHFDGSAFGLGSVGYDFAERLGASKAVLSADYVFNGQDNGGSTRSLEQVGSLHFNYARERCGVRTELTAGRGYQGQSNLWGAQVMPYYNITDKFQVVGRYSFIDSEDPNGIRFNRYENQVESGRGDRYNEFYLGFNYYFYGDKLKIQTGIDYADMEDSANDGGAYSGWAWTTGFRLTW